MMGIKEEIKDTVEEATGVLNEYELEDLATAIMKVVMSRDKDYHRLGKEIAGLLKDPEAMRGITLERSLSKLGYIKKSVVMSGLGVDGIEKAIVKYPYTINVEYSGDRKRLAEAIRSDLLKAMGEKEE